MKPGLLIAGRHANIDLVPELGTFAIRPDVARAHEVARPRFLIGATPITMPVEQLHFPRAPESMHVLIGAHPQTGQDPLPELIPTEVAFEGQTRWPLVLPQAD